MIQLNMNTNASTKNDNNYNNINNNNKLGLLLFSSSLLPSSGPPRARSRQSGTRVQFAWTAVSSIAMSKGQPI